MPAFPAITHVALTVNDLDRSVPWYERLFEGKPVLDEDTGPFVMSCGWLVGRHSSASTNSLTRGTPLRSTSVTSVWTTSPLRAPVGASSTTGWSAWTNSASPTAVSSKLPMDRVFRSEIRTPSHSSSSLHLRRR